MRGPSKVAASTSGSQDTREVVPPPVESFFDRQS
jgi:hypothetical protein